MKTTDGQSDDREEVGLEHLDHLTFATEDFEYNGSRYRYSEIAKIRYSATATKHSINFIPTGTSYGVDLMLFFNVGRVLEIKPEAAFFGARSKQRHEAVMRAAAILMNITFNQRIERYEQELDNRKFVAWERHQLHRNGDLFRSNQFKLNINDQAVKAILNPFAVTFSKPNSGFGGALKSMFVSTDESIDLSVDRDCFLYLMKHVYGKVWAGTPVPDKTKNSKELFNEALTVLGAKLSKSDGTVSQAEIDLFREYFGFNETELVEFREVFFRSANDTRSAEEVAGKVYELLASKREALEFILAGLIQIAAADGSIHYKELEFISIVAAEFNFSKRELDQLLAIFQSYANSSKSRENGGHNSLAPDLIHHLKILGLEKDANFEMVRLAYRELVRRHHPDILSAQGISPDKVRAAEQLLMAINVSYEWLEKRQRQSGS